MTDNRHDREIKDTKMTASSANLDAFVLDKGIFSNIFEKDIRRVYIYKKAERLAKAIHLVGPAFHSSPALRNRVDAIAVDLVDAATLQPIAAREEMSRELLALSSVLAIARSGGLLSAMNADVIAREAHQLLQEIATYEEPRLFLDDAPTLAGIFKATSGNTAHTTPRAVAAAPHVARPVVKDNKGPVSDKAENTSRRTAILDVLKTKGPVHIKEISTVIRGVSEKTIQRELALLVAEGTIKRAGDRRWTTYSLV